MAGLARCQVATQLTDATTIRRATQTRHATTIMHATSPSLDANRCSLLVSTVLDVAFIGAITHARHTTTIMHATSPSLNSCGRAVFGGQLLAVVHATCSRLNTRRCRVMAFAVS